jgi:hypothetical protein
LHWYWNEAILRECLQIRGVKDFSFQTSLKRAIRLVWDTARGRRRNAAGTGRVKLSAAADEA